MVLRFSNAAGDTELATWLRLELLGYYRSNPAMADTVEVPEYRTVTGQWFDEYGRRLVINDSGLAFINETRIRSGVLELEGLVGAKGQLAIRLPEFADIIKENLQVDVSVFRYSPTSIPSVLANIKAQLLDRLERHRDRLEANEKTPAVSADDELLELRPNIYGIGVNLKALWRRWSSRYKKR